MNKPVSYSLAKLLKEKGFEMTAGSCYFNGEFFTNQNVVHLQYPELKGEGYKERVADKIVFTPIIAEVIMWLYEKHGIWIWVEQNGKYWNGFNSINFKPAKGHFRSYNMFALSPTEAYEAAIKYVLNNLI